MYDNIAMILNKYTSPGTDFLNEIPQYLTLVVNEGTGQTGNYVIGYLDNIKLNISENRIKLSDFSICKYWLGDNFKTLTKGDTRQAIEKISNTLHLPFSMAIITSIDFANNFIMQYPEMVYYPYLGTAQYYNRLEQPNGLYYNNKLRQLVFYGKEYEQRVKRQVIPELYKNRNVLRYELRLRKRLRQQLKRQEITAGLLSDEVFYKYVLSKWENEYLAIQKINSKLIKMKPTGSKKELAENLALYTILELGQSQVLSKVKEWQQMGEISKKQAYDLRAFIIQLSRSPIDEKGNDLINELDRKVKEAARCW